MGDRRRRDSLPESRRSRRRPVKRHLSRAYSGIHSENGPKAKARVKARVKVKSWVRSHIRDWQDSKRPPGFGNDWFRRLLLLIAAVAALGWGVSQSVLELTLDLQQTTTAGKVVTVSQDQGLGSGSATVTFTAKGRVVTTDVGWAWPAAPLAKDQHLRIEYDPANPVLARVAGQHAVTALVLTSVIAPFLILQVIAWVVWFRRPPS